MSTAWNAEYAPDSLVVLAQKVKVGFGLRSNDIGIKGDESHTYGYHRSRNWVNAHGRGSKDYSNQLDLDRSGDGNWLAALDISLPYPLMVEVTSRLMSAAQACDPRLSSVREFYGTLDGKNVAGWDFPSGDWADSDDSHLWHVHVSFYRSRAGDDHSGVYDVLRGIEVDEMDLGDKYRLKTTFDFWDPTREEWIQKGGDAAWWDAAAASGGARNALVQRLTSMDAQIQRLQETINQFRADVSAGAGGESMADPDVYAEAVVKELKEELSD